MKDIKKFAEKVFNIRFFEESLDTLFQDQKIFGTYHRCIGQEAVAVAFTFYLNKKNDFVVSNHRNHGHYLAFKEKYQSLYDEIAGKSTGVSSGNGGSQVLMEKNFFSNGIMGTTIPIATGIAMGFKLKKLKNLVVCFLGDGALGPGVTYESLNLASLHQLPILFIIENNGIAQTTLLNQNLAGDINKRFLSFDIPVYEKNGDDIKGMIELSQNLISEIRNTNKPHAIQIKVNRLCAHSKGDDVNKNKIFKNIEDPIKILEKEINKKTFEIIKKKSESFINKFTKEFYK
jgi:TPP-dependent pyruvate/acetoin dehydrogenase alpha subunit